MKSILAIVFSIVVFATFAFAEIATIKHGTPASSSATCTPGTMKYGNGKLYFCYSTNKFAKYSGASTF